MVGPPPESWAVEAAEAGARLVIPGLWRLRLPTAWPAISHVNAYVIERADGGVVLVDCGTAGDPSCAAVLDAALAETGHRLEDVRVLAATHVHSDHIGPAASLLERSGAELWAHPDDAHFYDAMREPERIAAARGRRARREGVPEERLGPYRDVREELEGAEAAVAPDRPLVDGATIETALGPWHVVETPGHCPSHVCLVQREHRIAIVGDLLCAVFAPWIDYGYSADPFADTLASLDRLAAEAPLELALPGHGRPLTEVDAVIAQTRLDFERRLDQTREAVRSAPGGAYAITTRVFGEEEGLPAVGHMSEVLGYLCHLRRLGEVVREETADGNYLYR
jgi:glyoxylase-like metal-dependent hydrolase (beta-lactamase superfamily II)